MSESEPTDRRVWVRFLPVPGTPLPEVAEADHVIPQTARIRDVSATGVGLLVGSGLEPGTPVDVMLFHSRDRTSKAYRASVVHSRPQPDGTWLLGCSFAAPLSEQELWDFVAGIG